MIKLAFELVYRSKILDRIQKILLSFTDFRGRLNIYNSKPIYYIYRIHLTVNVSIYMNGTLKGKYFSFICKKNLGRLGTMGYKLNLYPKFNKQVPFFRDFHAILIQTRAVFKLLHQ